jgi:hypothetical protein
MGSCEALVLAVDATGLQPSLDQWEKPPDKPMGPRGTLPALLTSRGPPPLCR